MRRESIANLLDSCQVIVDVAKERGSVSNTDHALVIGNLVGAMRNVESQIPLDEDIELLAIEIDRYFEEKQCLNEGFSYDSFIGEVYLEVNRTKPTIEQVANIKHQLIGGMNPRVAMYHQCRELCANNTDDLLAGLLSL